ncbi:transglutaminase-like domain-containing protein [Pyrodictium abyssi]|uniref:Transglutaminase-like domain-containing protein n=1 Tax=Pyrodictium abyssi TaxID=54256 RepID=A0ABN6ZRC2_9CREN|nr:hypothetical protein PABY_23220 [Pyrodictium abyssi]
MPDFSPLGANRRARLRGVAGPYTAILILLLAASLSIAAYFYTKYVEAERLLAEKSPLAEKAEKLQRDYNALKESYQSLLAEYETLRGRYENATRELQAVEEKLRSLEKAYREALGERDRLEAQLEELQASYRDALQELEEAQTRLRELQAAQENLTRELASLQARYQSLLESYSNLTSEYRRLAELAEEARLQNRLYRLSELAEKLSQAAEEARTLIETSPELARGLAAFDPYERALAVLRWVSLDLAYTPPTAIYYVDTATQSLGNATGWLFPLELARRGAGDCQSLGLLVYALLAAARQPGEHVFLVGVPQSADTVGGAGWPPMGCYAALLVGAGGEAVLVDPMGWLNGAELEAAVSVYNGTTVLRLHLSPLQLGAEAKRSLAGASALSLELSGTVRPYPATRSGLQGLLESWTAWRNASTATVVVVGEGAALAASLEEAVDAILGAAGSQEAGAGFLAVELEGYVEQIAVYDKGPLPVFTVYTREIDEDQDAVEAYQVIVTRRGMRVLIPVNQLLDRLGPGEYTVIGWLGSARVFQATLVLGRDSAEIRDLVYVDEPRTGCSVLESVPGFDLYHALVCGVNTTSLEVLRSRVLGGGEPSPEWLVWRVLEYADSNFTYNYDRANAVYGTGFRTYTPLEMLSRGSGICVDYAVFEAAALLAGGLHEAYVVTIEWAEPPGHAVAAAPLGGTLLVLDQHLPPIEWQDYMEYVANSSSPVAEVNLYRVALLGNETVVTALLQTAPSLPDTYPEDRIDEKLAVDIVALVANATGMAPAEQLATVLPLWSAWKELRLPALQEVPGTPSPPIDAAYTPLLREQWAHWLAGHATDLLEKYYSSAVEAKGSFWLALERGDALSIRVYAVPGPVPPATVNTTATTLTIHVDVEDIPQVDPLRDFQVLLYTPDARLCAGVTPPGWRYTSIPYIEASRWTTEGGVVTIEVDLARLGSLISDCGQEEVYLAILFRGYPVYVYRLENPG